MYQLTWIRCRTDCLLFQKRRNYRHKTYGNHDDFLHPQVFLVWDITPNPFEYEFSYT